MSCFSKGRSPLFLSDVRLSQSETDALYHALVFYEDDYFSSNDDSDEHKAVNSLLKKFFNYVK